MYGYQEESEPMITTRNLFVAAYALASGIPLLKVLPGEWYTFCFDNANGHARQAVDEWHTGRAMVNAQRYAAAYRQARHLLYNEQRAAS